MENKGMNIDKKSSLTTNNTLFSKSSSFIKSKSFNLNMTDGVLIPSKSNQGVFSSWRIAFVGALALLSALIIFSPEVYRKIFLVCIQGIPVTFECTIFAIIFAIIIGVISGLQSVSQKNFVRTISGVYVQLIRGIPLLVQLIFIYYAVGKFLHIQGMFAAIVAMAICFGAYISEIVRAGIESIPKGQMEAAIALGMSRRQAFTDIILPQTIKVILPAISNEFISMLKDSSLVSAIALSDILRRGREYISRTFLSLETMLIVALIYLIITLMLSWLVGKLEERLKKNG
ncbi:MAG: amino acid ABC transporter permease [Sphaerochaetaceae bacterium]|nr:amino acid ABC transporter permease [Sphaerochaetaceae bacterium]